MSELGLNRSDSHARAIRTSPDAALGSRRSPAGIAMVTLVCSAVILLFSAFSLSYRIAQKAKFSMTGAADLPHAHSSVHHKSESL